MPGPYFQADLAVVVLPGVGNTWLRLISWWIVNKRKVGVGLYEVQVNAGIDTFTRDFL